MIEKAERKTGTGKVQCGPKGSIDLCEIHDAIMKLMGG
jgi:hypothetical protein